MKCLICTNQTKRIRAKYCSRECAEKAKFGRKRPDVTERNKADNPVWNKDSLEKMRASLTGKKQSDETRIKRSKSLKKYYRDNPEAKERLRSAVWEKYTSKIAGTGWTKIRLKVLDREGYKCQNCGEDKRTRLLVHHIDWHGKRRGVSSKDWNNSMSNLQTLCYKCHNQIHRHKSADYKVRLEKKIAP